jgi:hypothetical protein
MKRLTLGLLCAAFSSTFAAALSAPLFAAAQPAVNPTLSFEDRAVVASGMTPGGCVVWFAATRELNQGALDWSHLEQLAADSGGAGSVRLDLGKPVPAQSIWFAVDLASGQFAVKAPEGYPLRPFDLPANAIPATLNRIEIARRLLLVVLVRPGVGAWTLRVGDGGPGDADGVADGTVRADLAQLAPIGNSPSALQALSPSDVLLVVDQERMDFLAVHLH